MGNDGILRARTIVLSLARAIFLSVGLTFAVPTPYYTLENGPEEVEEGALWVLYVASMVLVLSGGAFAGLTIALMGQDEIYLQVISLDSEEPQRKNAKRVHDLLKKGKHWVLVTLLLSNVIVNETLPVVLDRCFGGGVAAVVGSTILIVIFGEILPQSVCVRYGLQIGGYMSKPVLLMMYLLAPVAWPTAKLLDWLLGEDHGTVYKKSGLKTLVTLHKSLGEVDERLNQDEVTIISAVLDLKRKPVEEVMTPMEDVFIMSEDTVLDEKTIDQILDAGYSRIPIHQTGNPTNFVGMLLVKILITYDPEDGKRVKDFALAALPETRPETSCLDIINFFQEGKSHMVLISESPGDDHGALGVVTLEDVIEELIGEEIIDESDVYVDVHKAIRRSHPAPKARALRRELMAKDLEIRNSTLIDIEEDGQEPRPKRDTSVGSRTDASAFGSSPKMATLLMRRRSAGQDGQLVHTMVPVKANFEDMRDHLKHLGPSNPASNPKSTRVSAVKIKPGSTAASSAQQRSSSVATDDIAEDLVTAVDERTSLLGPQLNAKDGIQALQQSYTESASNPPTEIVTNFEGGNSEQVTKGTQTKLSAVPESDTSPTQDSTTESLDSIHDAIGRRRGHVRSGSITENIVESGGIRKVILEANDSPSDTEGQKSTLPAPSDEDGTSSAATATATASTKGNKGKKKNRRKNRNGGK
ncbi:DUF21-domain-containing protein [Daldinia sp. FL1419]|nr:DUF21-domain-containing protein [Daldinia sp. FL1419]